MIKKFDDYINELFSASMKRNIEGNSKREDSLTVLLYDFVGRHNRNENNYYIEDNKVCCKHDVKIYDDDLIDGKFPFQFGKVDGYFYCSYCEKLESLKGAPQELGCFFSCFCCKKLESLEGAPIEVGDYFDCSYCKKLESLEGAPQKVGKHFNCSYCDKLESLEGCPQEVGENFICDRCGKRFTKNDLPEGTKLKGNFYN